jgi:hypothetical protein
VDVSRQQLAERFRGLSNDDLLARVGAGDLTPEALEVAHTELRSRGLPPPPVSRVAAEEVDDAVATEGNLVTVVELWNPIQANVVRGVLETTGVPVYMWGEHLGVTHNFLAAASGGIRLQVPRDQVAHAKEVLAAFERGDFAMKDEDA